MLQDQQLYVSLNTQVQVQQQDLKQKVQQDFLNIIEMAQDVQETLEYFNMESQKEIVKVQFNRLIVQLNLSCAIHYDINFTSQNQKQFLDNQKVKMNKFLEKYISQFNPEIQVYLKKYQQNCLSKNPFMQQENLKEINRQSNFNQQVVQKVLNGQAEVDRISLDIRNGKQVQDLKESYIQERLKSRKNQAQVLLKQNFPDQQQQDKGCFKRLQEKILEKFWPSKNQNQD